MEGIYRMNELVCMVITEVSPLSNDHEKRVKSEDVEESQIREAVRKRYRALAEQETSCCGPKVNTMCGCSTIYSDSDVASLPSDAAAVSAGCGNPTAIADLKSGMTVVDLGSGGGIDVFLSAKKVGPTGRAIGIDATPEMIVRARRTAKENGFDNVEFRLGEIEHIPLQDSSADVVISNCVINLSPFKQQVFNEAFRILKPGGRLAVSDIILLRELPDELKTNLAAWSSCVSGAVSEEDYIGGMKLAGFVNIKVQDKVIYTYEQMRAYVPDVQTSLSLAPPDNNIIKVSQGTDLSNMIASYRIIAEKP